MTLPVRLPEIPYATMYAGELGAYYHGEETTDDIVARILTAAWPHLYAAALRHAADAFDINAGDRWFVDGLRRLADEATS